jgi:hypothetical protein
MIRIFSLVLLLSLYGCAHKTNSTSSPDKINYISIYQKYGQTHFFGMASGKGATQQIAIKIAKAKALGELASNVKVTVMSKLEVISTAEESEKQSSFNETLKQQVISIGNATVRSPEYEILNLNQKKDGFEAEVLAKKNMKEHFLSAGFELNVSDTEDLFNALIGQKD